MARQRLDLVELTPVGALAEVAVFGERASHPLLAILPSRGER